MNAVNPVDEGIWRVFAALGGAADGWELLTTPPLPDRWPLTPHAMLSTYGFAYRTDPDSPRLKIASKPFAIATTNLSLQHVQLGATQAIEVGGTQGISPISGAIITRMQTMPSFATLFAIAMARPLNDAECDALATRYAFFRQCHGVAFEALRHRHPQVSSWIDMHAPR